MNINLKKCFLIVLVILFVPLITQCKKIEEKKYTIGVINYSPAGEPALEGLRKGLSKFGYIENENIIYIYNGVITDKEKLDEEVQRLISMNIDLIFAMSTPAALVAKSETSESFIPIVFAPVSSPVEAGIVQSMSQPGGNITGVTFGPQEPRRLEMLLKIAPDVKKIYVPYNPNDKSPVLGVERLKPAAEKLGLTLIMEELENRQEVLEAISTFREDIDAVFLPTDSMMVNMTEEFSNITNSRKIPMTCPQREGVSKGALFSYGFSIEDTGIQAARIVDQIFKGVKPEDIPVELSEFTLTINLETARNINISIPDELARQAIIIRE